MTWIKKTNRICKCGHKHHPDHENPGKLFGMKYNKNTKCNGKVKVENVMVDCCCHRFLNRDYPTLSDKIMTIVSLCGMGFLIINFGLLFFLMNQSLDCHTLTCNQILDKPMYSVRQLGGIAIPLLLVITLWIAMYLFPTDYFKNIKRETKPIQDEQMKELVFDGFEIVKEEEKEDTNEQK